MLSAQPPEAAAAEAAPDEAMADTAAPQTAGAAEANEGAAAQSTQATAESSPCEIHNKVDYTIIPHKKKGENFLDW